MRRQPGADWATTGWPYSLLHRVVPPWHNRLVGHHRGLDRFPRGGGVVLASNHTSAWDPVILGCALPRPVSWLAKREVFERRFPRWFFTKANCIPVDRQRHNPQALAAAADALRAGRVVGVFPEGTRHVGALGPAKPGAARLALQTGAPIVPVGIASERFWPRGQRAPRLREPVYVSWGAPFFVEGDADDPDVVRAATTDLMAAVRGELASATAARDARAAWARA